MYFISLPTAALQSRNQSHELFFNESLVTTMPRVLRSEAHPASRHGVAPLDTNMKPDHEKTASGEGCDHVAGVLAHSPGDCSD